MKNSRTVFLLFFLTLYFVSFSQINSIQLSVTPTFGASAFHLADSAFTASDSSDLRITELKFYLSNIQLLQKGKVVMEEKASFHLLDASYINSLTILMDDKQPVKFDELKFNLGIDSVTSVSGVLGGDLDPTKGMYWAWQSGYINFKLEGTSPLCKTRNNEFQFHLGGYQPPNNCLQTVRFPISNANNIHLKLDVQNVLKQIDLMKSNQIMSPSAEAVRLSKIIANSFTLSQN
jgi:hypothetical protein